MAHLKQFAHLKLQLDVIKKATNNFADEDRIGRGGFGSVYKANIGGHTMVAMKRLNRASGSGQGDIEFWKEVSMLSQYKHENIVSLLGFCDDSDEKILVYPYMANGSLDKHLNNDNLRWIARLKICIGAARGLEYLHSAVGAQQRVLHRDIKSANILLDEDWNAKISDFGLSKLGPANQEHTFVYSRPVGTHGYVDPLYDKTGLLTKETDVYSFGVVLFEVLCGTLCYKYQDFIKRVQKSYKENTINEIIYNKIKDEINATSLQKFATIAYECLERDHERRPLMTDVVRGLETALRYQEDRNVPVANSYFPPEEDLGVASESDGAGVLVVTIHRGVNLKVKHPYVKLKVGTDKKHTTTKKNNQNPVWKEWLHFTLKKPKEANLLLGVYSKSLVDKFLHKGYLGDVSIPLGNVVKEKHENAIYHIKNSLIHVGLYFLHFEARNDRVANSYFPTEEDIDMSSESDGEGVLVVTIHRGVNLKVKQPYVKLKVGTDKRKTTTKKNIQKPVWEESFLFNIEKPAKANLLLGVCSKSLMDKFLDKFLCKGYLGDVSIPLANVVKEKHKNNIYHIGDGRIHAELHFLHSASSQRIDNEQRDR